MALEPAADRAVAVALAQAFGTVPWAMPDLLAVGHRVLDARPIWLNSCITAVLGLYAQPPPQAELVDTLAGLPVFRRGQDTDRSDRAQERAFERRRGPSEMEPGPWPVLALPHLGHLAGLLGLTQGELAWFADCSGRQRRAPGRWQLYRSSWRERPGRTPRLLEVPHPRLAAAQRVVQHEVLAHIPPHPAAHGFVRGRSVHTGAAPHAARPAVLSLDLTAFFAHVTPAQVIAVLRTAGYPEGVARALAGVCATVAPARVLSAMPPGGEPPARFGLGRALAVPHLPQGAPTSPHLANLAAHGLDRRLAALAATAGLAYTRYADDLTFSGLRPARVVPAVTRIAAAEGFLVHPDKTRVRPAGRRQLVTGLVVNRRPAVPREEYDRLRAVLHNAARSGPAAQNRADHRDFRAHLLGRIGWVGAGHPERATRLQAAFDRIVWP